MKINIVELQKAIKSLLDSVHSRVYFQDVPTTTTYPYLVYDLPNSFDDGNNEVFVLEIDGWDKTNDTTIIDTLMAQVDSVFNKYAGVLEWGTERSSIVIFRDSRLSILDEDKKIKRRKYVYSLRVI